MRTSKPGDTRRSQLESSCVATTVSRCSAYSCMCTRERRRESVLTCVPHRRELTRLGKVHLMLRRATAGGGLTAIAGRARAAQRRQVGLRCTVSSPGTRNGGRRATSWEVRTTLLFLPVTVLILTLSRSVGVLPSVTRQYSDQTERGRTEAVPHSGRTQT